MLTQRTLNRVAEKRRVIARCVYFPSNSRPECPLVLCVLWDAFNVGVDHNLSSSV